MNFLILVLIHILLNFRVNAKDIEYSKCLETQVYCQSLPVDCVRKNTQCNILLIAIPYNGSAVQFELYGKYDTTNRWFAMGLSAHRQMGDASVTEIYISNDGKKAEMRQSWNQGFQNQVIIGGVAGVRQIGSVSSADGILSGKWIRDGVTEVHSKQFDILSDKYNIMLATGPLDSDNNKRMHTKYSVSQTTVDFNFSNNQTLIDTYKNCKQKTEDICVGLPFKCIESENCDLVLAVTKTGHGMSSGTVSFQMIGKSQSPESGWIAMALSDDSQMGSDSVVECLVLSNGTTIFRNSFNSGYSNLVVGNVDGIVGKGPVTYESGLINCKWTRTAQTKVKDMVFDMKAKKYYILLAKGSLTQNTDTKRIHSEVLSSDSSFDLGAQQTGTTVVTTSQPLASTTSK